MTANKKTSIGEDLFKLIDFIGQRPVLLIKNSEIRKETDADGKITISEKTSEFEVTLKSK